MYISHCPSLLPPLPVARVQFPAMVSISMEKRVQSPLIGTTELVDI